MVVLQGGQVPGHVGQELGDCLEDLLLADQALVLHHLRHDVAEHLERVNKVRIG